MFALIILHNVLDKSEENVYTREAKRNFYFSLLKNHT